MENREQKWRSLNEYRIKIKQKDMTKDIIEGFPIIHTILHYYIFKNLVFKYNTIGYLFVNNELEK